MASENVVIVGGGLVGVCAAYYMSKQGLNPLVIESNQLACAASGKGLGFMARTWCDEGPSRELMHRGWALHEQLAKELRGASTYQYRKLQTLAVTTKAADGSAEQKADAEAGTEDDVVIPDWVDGTAKVLDAKELGGFMTTAQVDGEQFVNQVWAAAEQNGAKLRIDTVTGMQYTGESVTGVTLQDGTVIPATAVVLALGPWMSQAEPWLPQGVKLPAIWNQKYHTLTFRPTEAPEPAKEPSAYGLYVSHQEPDGTSLALEMYSRRDGSFLVVGGKSLSELEEPGTARPVSSIVEALQATAGTISATVANSKLVSAAGTFIPLSPDNVPVIGKLSGAGNVIVAGGLGCFGVTFSPAVGELVAELVRGVEPTIKTAAAYGTDRFAL